MQKESFFKLSTRERLLTVVGFSAFYGLLTALLLTHAPLGINVFILTIVFIFSNFVFRFLFLKEFYISRYDILSLLMIPASLSVMFHMERNLQIGTVIYLMFMSFPSVIYPSFSLLLPRFSFITSFIIYPIDSFLSVIEYPKIFSEIKVGHFKFTQLNYIKNTLIGFTLSLPFICILIILLASADSIFGQFITHGFSSVVRNMTTSLNFLTLGVLIFGLTGLAAFIGEMYTFLVSKFPQHNNKDFSVPQKGINNIIASVFLGNINLVFLAFVVIQFVYLFGGEDNISSRGITYSEYARKGFWELQFVSIIMISILYIMYRFVEAKNLVGHTIFKVMAFLNILFTLVIIYSAHYRMFLYEQAYGYTLLRFYPHALIILEGLIFIFLLGVNLNRNIFKYFSLYTLVISSFFLIGMAFINPVQFIISRNVKLEEPDIEYIKSFGPENFIYSITADEQYYFFTCEDKEFVENIDKEGRFRGLNIVREVSLAREEKIVALTQARCDKKGL